MMMRGSLLSVAMLCVVCVFAPPWTMKAEALETVEPALVHPIDRVYPLVAFTGNETPTAEDWAGAFVGEGFFADGAMEKDPDCAVFRMLEGKDRLYVRVDCPAGGTDARKGSVHFYVTQSGKPDFPCVAVVLDEDGEGIVGLVRRARTWWTAPEVLPLDETVIPRRISATETGWALEFSLPFDELDIPREGFVFNVAHGIGLEGVRGTKFAWCDLGGRMHCTANQFDVYARAVSADKMGFPSNGLRLPAQLSVGLNRLSLEKADSDARLCIGDEVLKPMDGVFEVVVCDRGPLDMCLTERGGTAVATYHADVRRPLLIDAKERYLANEVDEFELDVSIDLAGDATADIVFACRRGNGPVHETKASLGSGLSSVRLPVPRGDGHDVHITAEGTVSLPGGKSLALAASHWFAVGVTEQDVAVYRDGIRDLPTDKLLWAILVDALPGLVQCQQGDGEYKMGWRRSGDLWAQSCVYVPALLYKTERPDNPYFGDKRLLESAVMSMEYALRPEVRINEYGFPDASRHAYMLTYELLKDDIEPERRAYWAKELERLADAGVGRFLRAVVDKYTFYSVDCDTSTNQIAYHIPDVYLAGRLFGREDLKEVGRMLMRRLARHGRDGYFEEQRGSPVNHYTWMTANALGEYYHASGDATVLPTLQACARYMTAITTADGYTMALHDSRNSHHRNIGCGEYVLSLTPEGRRAVRAIILGRMGNNPAGMRGQRLFRTAEDAVYFQPGDEADPFGTNSEHPFPYGILVRKDGFQYGLSTISRGAVSGNYVLDAQNVIEIFHNDAECILNGGNSQSQPEAGNFWRKLDEPDWDSKTVGTSNDYLPHATMLAAIPGGHELGLAYRTFEASVVVTVQSPTKARMEVFVLGDKDKGPVTFSFFPGVSEGEKITVGPDGTTLNFRQVTFRANRPFRVERGFRLLNPYAMEYTYTHKPVRCSLDLENEERFILDIDVGSK